MKLTGVVENVEFTQGGMGNQWTTIDGKRYATWWDVRRIDWKVGDRVEFESYTAGGFNGATLPGAKGIKKIPQS